MADEQWRTVKTDWGTVSYPASYFSPQFEPRIAATRERLAQLLGDALDMGRFVACYDRKQWITGKLDELTAEDGV